jgi:uncharacterized membrane protein YjjP (DUF1212 family)
MRWPRRLRALVGALAARRSGAAAEPEGAGVADVLGGIGTAMLAGAQATSDVEGALRDLAHAYGRDDLRSYVLPTLVIVGQTGPSPRTAMYPAEGTPLRLDQIAELERLIGDAGRDRLAPDEVLARLARIAAAPPRFGAVLRVLGNVVLTVGFGLVLSPTLQALPAYAVLGALVGTIIVVGSRFRTLPLILPILTAFVVTLVAGALLPQLVGTDPLRIVAPALVAFLPGLVLTTAAVELTSNQVVAGSARLVYGLAQLGLLAAGVAAALTLIGSWHTTTHATQLGPWAPWVGILLTAVGYTVFSSAPRRAFGWILLALVVAYAAQLGTSLLVGPALSGFGGALAAVLLVRLVRLLPGSPPAGVMLTCAYWLLVPGALGFIGIAGVTTDAAGATNTVLQAGLSVVAIAIGSIVGSGLVRDVSAVRRALRTPAPPS